MTPIEWPLRLIPRRSPPPWRGLAISAGALAAAVALRALLLGWQNASGLSATYFPALIITTLYAGTPWGWTTWLGSLLIGLLTPPILPLGVPEHALTLLYALSGALTVLVASTLRETLLRLDEARAAQTLARKALVDSEARFRALADSAPILMWVSRTDGKRAFANKTYVDFAGAIDVNWRKVLHPEDVSRILREQAAGESSRKQFMLDARYRRADGEYRWLRSVSQPRFEPDGSFAGLIGVAFDITDSKRAEADLLRINDLLAERVDAALAERDEAETALRRAQKLEAVGQLTGGVAHDFNNLLTVVIGALDLIQRHPADANRRERMIEAALAAARRGERLTQQLLAFSRRQALKPELVRVDELLAESEPLLRRAVGEAVQLAFCLTASEAVASVDPSQFEAAVMNLVVNARDATANGGAIRVESRRVPVAAGQVEELEAGDYLCVAVHDTGAGMDAETVQRVFEPFFTTKEPGRGTGLGLSQVYGFARQSGGTVSVDSALGKGTTVRIYLPLSAEVPRTAETASDAAPTPQGPRLTVLLVEDDPEVGAMVEAMLLDLGHHVLRADGVAEALKILRRPGPLDLLLTDLVMPGDRTGVDLAHEAVQLRPGLPVILSSGYTGEVLTPAAQAPWPLLRKPYAAAALGRMIEEVTQQTPEAA